MKNRKTVVVAFMLCAVMLLGVGYAALSDVLDITGSADVDFNGINTDFDNDIYFTAAKANQDGNTASLNADNKDKASFTANTLKFEDGHKEATFTFTIQNDSVHDVTVTPKLAAGTGNTNPDYFEISSDWGGNAKVIEAGKSETYTVTVKIVKAPTSAVSGSFLIELAAEADNQQVQP